MKPNLLANQNGSVARYLLAAALVLLTVIASTPAWAHKVTVFAWVEDQTVYTQSKFSGGRSAKNAQIAVYNAAGEKLLEGRTDTQGRFAFTPPKPETLRIVLMAGSGHRGEWRVAAEDFASTTAQDSAPAETRALETPATHAAARTAEPPQKVEELRAMIEASLDKKLAPVLRRLESQGQGPALKDIFGGIGYIVGIVGLVAYMQSRRKTG